MRLTFLNQCEQLGYEADRLKSLSQDQSFTQYIFTVENRLNISPDKASELRSELVRNYSVYYSQMATKGISVSPTYFDAIYQGMDAPIVMQQPVMQQPVVQQPVMQQPVVQQPVVQQPVMQQPVIQQNYQQASVAEQPRKTGKAEYAIGAILLSIFGSILILTGIITLAVNFFDSFWQGMSLYGICILLLLFSELFLRKRIKPLSMVFSSLSLVGLLVVTMVNYYYLELFGLYIALIIVFAITLLITVLGRLHKSFLFSIIGLVSTYSTFMLSFIIDNNTDFIILLSVILVESIVWCVFPSVKHGKAFSFIQLGLNTVFACGIIPSLCFPDSSEHVANMYTTFFVLGAFVVALIIMFLAGMRYYLPASDKDGKLIQPSVVGISFMFWGVIITYSILFMVRIFNCYLVDRDVICLIVLGVVLAFSVGFGFVLHKKNSRIFQHMIYALSVVSSFVLISVKTSEICIIGELILMIVIGLITYKYKTPGIIATDMVVKAFVFLFSIGMTMEYTYSISCYVCIAACAIALFMSSGIKTATEIMFSSALAFGICQVVPYNMWMIVISGIIMVTVCMVNNLKWMKDKAFLAVNIYELVALCGVLGFLNHPFYKGEMLTTLVVFVFGLGTFIMLMQKKCKMFFAGSIIPLALYLTYFVFMVRLEEDFITSAILMVVALLCVALGFLLKQLPSRIFGLVLAIFVCLKLVIYDITDADTMVKVIMYFAVGILALVIGGIYIIVETNFAKKNKNEISTVQVPQTPQILQEQINSDTISNYEEANTILK